MTQTVLIAALSGRALAQSARKAGYTPLVVDGFGDEDTRTCAFKTVRIDSAFRSGFRKKSITAALAKLVHDAPSPPIGLVLGTGFEDQPSLVEDLANTYPILGNDAKTIALTKDPKQIFALLRDRGIRHPETSLTPPDNPQGWLKKRIGGTGGVHIKNCATLSRPLPTQNCYYQRHHDGTPISIAGAVSKNGFAIGICRQWLSPTHTHPFRFGGMLTPPQINADTEARLIDMTIELTRATGLKGLISIDFLATNEDILFLEINPRPTAALDILDGEAGHIFEAHMLAVNGSDPTDALRTNETGDESVRAISYLYADPGALAIPTDVSWPVWAHDRPAAGTPIKRGHPLASITATADTEDAAKNLCLKRLGQLNTMLYGPEKPNLH